jgi:hypothetical protein
VQPGRGDDPTKKLNKTTTKSSECFIEDQAFLQSYDSAPRLPPPPYSRQQVFSLSQSFCVSPLELEGDGGGQVAKSTTARKPSPL